MVFHKTKSSHRIGKEFPTQRQLTLNYTRLIRKIYSRDNRLTPRQQQLAIMALPGINSDEMESLMICTGPALTQQIRKFISAHRAKTRSVKTRARRKKNN